MFDTYTIQTAHIYLAPEGLSNKLDNILNYLKENIMDRDQLAAALTAAADKTDKIIAEVQASTAALQAAIAAAGTTTPAIDAALARLEASLTVADDLNPDAAAAPADPAVAP